MTETLAPKKRSNLIYRLPAFIFAGLVLLFVAGLFWNDDPSHVPSALIGRPVLSFTLEPLEGLTHEGKPLPGLKAEDLKGRITIVNIWASWCAPCRQEHPLLMELARDRAIRVVGNNYKDNPENARRFLSTLGNPFAAVGVDPNGRTAIDWGVYGVPETFIVGPDSTIRHKHIGPLTPENLPAFKAALASALR